MTNNKVYLWIGIILLLVTHGWLVYRQFPLGSLSEGGVPVKGDVIRYLATSESRIRLNGQGYDPLTMAGYASGGWNSIGKMGYELLNRVIPISDLGQRMWIILVGVSVLSPLLYVYVMGWYVQCSLLLRSIVSMSIWHLDSQVSYFWGFGNVLYPSTASMVPLVILVGHIALIRRSIMAMVLTSLVMAWQFYAHTTVLFVVVPVLLCYALLESIWSKSSRPLVLMVVSGATAMLAILPWAVYLFETRGDVVPQPHQWFQAHAKHLLSDVLNDRVYRHQYDRNTLFRLIVVAGVIGTIQAYRQENRRLLLLGCAGIWSLIITYTFSYLPGLRSVQPYRFMTISLFCFGVPAVCGIQLAIGVLVQSSLGVRRLALASLLVVGPSFTGYFLDLLQPPLECGLTTSQRNALDLLREIPVQGRVLCQDETIGHLVPYWTGHSVLGGLNDQAFVRQRYAGIMPSGVVFGKPIQDWSESSLRVVLDVYAVDLVLFSSAACRDFANRNPDLFEPIQSSDGWNLYRVKRDAFTWCLQGEADVDVQPDHIVVNMKDEYVVIKWHYNDTIKANAQIFPVNMNDSPLPFLGIRSQKGSRIVIR